MQRFEVACRWLASALLAVSAIGAADAKTPLVTGNGFGFTVVSPDTGDVSKFYAHPYSFVRPDPATPYGEGVETINFIKRLEWTSTPLTGTAVHYLSDSPIVRVTSDQGEGSVYQPFGLQRDALILHWQPAPGTQAAGTMDSLWTHTVLSDAPFGPKTAGARLIRFADTRAMLLLVPLAQTKSSAGRNLSASNDWALIALADAEDAPAALADLRGWRAGLSPSSLIQRELAQFEAWRVRPNVQFRSDAERHLWRQSETMLRIAQSREPNNADNHGNGLIVAALPDGVYFTPWVRDMSWATVALTRMGHRREARAALLAYFNAQPTGKLRDRVKGGDYQISLVRYFGNGEEEPWFTMEGSPNVEFDDWGEVLWALGVYLQQYPNDRALLSEPTARGSLYKSARDDVAKPLIANLEPFGAGLIVAKDTSIWEEHQPDAKHFAFSTAMAEVGLRHFEIAARLMGDRPTIALMETQARRIHTGFDRAFIRGGAVHGTLEPGEKNDVDGALLPLVNFGLITDGAIVDDLLRRMATLKVVSGGYKRVTSNYTDPKIFEYWYERQEFLFVDLNLAEVYRRRGRIREADATLERITAKSALDNNIIPEMYVAEDCPLFPGAIGDPTGARPMVGYGAGAYLLALMARKGP